MSFSFIENPKTLVNNTLAKAADVNLIVNTLFNGLQDTSKRISVGRTDYLQAISSPASATTAINGEVSSIFYGSYNTNTTITFSNFVDGQLIILVATASSNYPILTFQGTGLTFLWAGGIANGTVDEGKTNIYTFLRVGSNVYINTSRNYS